MSTRWTLSEEARADLERLTDFLAASAPEAALETVDIILEGLHILASHPLMGRPLSHGLRELVISRGRSGYLALYRYDALTDLALVLAVKHQREDGYH